MPVPPNLRYFMETTQACSIAAGGVFFILIVLKFVLLSLTPIPQSNYSHISDPQHTSQNSICFLPTLRISRKLQTRPAIHDRKNEQDPTEPYMDLTKEIIGSFA